MLAAFDGKMEHPKDSSAIELYSRFHSLFELRLAAAGAVESDVANTILAELAAETQQFVARLAATQGATAEWIPSWRSQVAARPVYD